MSRKSSIDEYKRKLEDVRYKYLTAGLTQQQFYSALAKSLQGGKKNNRVNTCVRCFIKCVLFILIIYTCDIMFLERPNKLLFCKIQELIYPGLRVLRIAALPILTVFPTLTELYDETCIIQNPYFYVADLDCWVCKDLNRIEERRTMDLPINSIPPFLFKTNQQEVNFTVLKDIYSRNKKLFDNDAPKIFQNQRKHIVVENFFTNHNIVDNHSASSYMWKLMRLHPIQVMKSIFPRPEIIPKLGLSTERFIIIDEPNSKPYKLPDTECNFVFVIQSQGERIIDLEPTAECAKECSSVSIKLKPPYMLWYNWWYWRPVSREVLTDSLSVSYIGSYC